MAEYIEREAVLDLRYHSEKYQSWVIDACDVEDLEAADVVEVKHGRWIESLVIQTDISALYDYTCSECGIVSYRESNYCPNCGARMDGE